MLQLKASHPPLILSAAGLLAYVDAEPAISSLGRLEKIERIQLTAIPIGLAQQTLRIRPSGVSCSGAVQHRTLTKAVPSVPSDPMKSCGRP